METRKSYQYHKPSEKSLVDIAAIRKAFSGLHDLVEQLAPTSRERAIALTELETSAMWAIKAIVCNDPASVVQE